MPQPDLRQLYLDYIDCLNRRDWAVLGRFVADDVRRNGQTLGLAGYRAMLERDCCEIPDLGFVVELLVVDAPWVASRLSFDCTPAGRFLGLAVGGRRVRFAENVFYEVRDGRICDVRSVIDKASIEAQLG
jgi:predicted ester cyclase